MPGWGSAGSKDFALLDARNSDAKKKAFIYGYSEIFFKNKKGLINIIINPHRTLIIIYPF